MLIEIKKQLTFERITIIALIFMGFLVYGNTFPNQMFWDDFDFILHNEYLRDWQYFPKFFSENVIAGAGLMSNYWRPVLQIVFSLEWHIWNDWAPAYHFINTSFHIADAILLFFVLKLIFKNKWISVITALIFLIHPIQTEAVSYVNSLGDSLSVFWMLFGFWFYLQYFKNNNGQYYFVALLFYVLALMSKETAIIMPALMGLLHFFFLPSAMSVNEKLKKIARLTWPFFLMALLYILLRATSLNFVNTFNLYNEQNAFTSSIINRIFTFFHILTIYLGLLFWPIGLHMERMVALEASLFSFPVIMGALIFFGLLIVAILKIKKYPILSFGIFWFFIGLSPTSNIAVPINGMLYEHWLYFPMIGISIILSWLGYGIIKNFPKFRVLFILILAVIAIAFSILTIKRNREWHDPIIFYNQVLTFTPDSYRVINNLGMAYADIRNSSKAKEMYEKAIVLSPKNPVAYHNLGNIYREMGGREEAIENFKAAISFDPKFVYSYNNLADIYLKEKNYAAAREVLEHYLEQTSDNLPILTTLVQIAITEKSYDIALAYLEMAQKIAPDDLNIRKAIYQVGQMK